MSVTHLAEKQPQAKRSFSIKYKRHAINAINVLMLHGHTVSTASKELNIPHWYYRRWRKMVMKVDQLASADAIVPSKITGESCKVHPGRCSKLGPFQGKLLNSVFEMRQQGLLGNTGTLRK